jgi:hypothetical protein
LLIPALWLLNQDFGLLSGARLCRIAPGDLAAVSAWRQAEAAGSVLDAELASLDAKFAAQRANCQVPPPASPPVVPLLGPGGGQ